MAEIIENALRDQIIDEDVPQDRIVINNAQLVRQSYEGQTSDNINTVVDNTNRTITTTLLQNQYASKSAFPSVGSNKLLYVDLSDNSIWRYDTTGADYICVGRDNLTDDVKVDNATVVDENKTAQLHTINGNYNANLNKLATEADLPTQASDVGALSDSTKYGASLSVSGTSVQLKDQNGNNLGSAITTQDTGATSAEATGVGNAVTSVNYDPTTRKLNLTKGETFLKTSEYVVDSALSTSSENPVQNKVIAELIPSGTSSSDKLVKTSTMNSSISTATATFRGTYNLVSDLNLTSSAPEQQIATALASTISTADNNDYCFVQVPTSTSTPTSIERVDRYKYDGTNWAFEYSLNNSGFTASQWAAVNSGLSSSDKTKLDGIEAGAEINDVNSVNGKTGTVSLLASDVNALPIDGGAMTSGIVFGDTASEAIKLPNKGYIKARVSDNSSTYYTILQAGGQVVELGSSNFTTRIYSNGRPKIYDYSQSPTFGGDAATLDDIPDISGLANKTMVADYTLTSSNWSNNSYTLSITGKTSSNNARVSNSNTGTDAEVLANAEAIADANIYKITDNGTSLTFVCETTPTTNIKIQVEVYE